MHCLSKGGRDKCSLGRKNGGSLLPNYASNSYLITMENSAELNAY